MLEERNVMSAPKPPSKSVDAKKDIRSLKGIIRSPNKKPVSVKEMNKAIAEGFSEM
jgi:hypothetical protein